MSESSSKKYKKWTTNSRAATRMTELINEGILTEENYIDDAFLKSIFNEPRNKSIFSEFADEKKFVDSAKRSFMRYMENQKQIGKLPSSVYAWFVSRLTNFASMTCLLLQRMQGGWLVLPLQFRLQIFQCLHLPVLHLPLGLLFTKRILSTQA